MDIHLGLLLLSFHSVEGSKFSQLQLLNKIVGLEVGLHFLALAAKGKKDKVCNMLSVLLLSPREKPSIFVCYVLLFVVGGQRYAMRCDATRCMSLLE